MSIAWATFHRSWTVTMRAYPGIFFLATLLLGMLTIGLAYLALHAIGGGRVGADFVARTGTSNYLTYVAIGAAAFMFTVRLMLWVSRELLVEQRGGTLGALLVTPGRRTHYLLGLTLFGLVNALLEVVVLIVFTVLLGASLTPVDGLTTLISVLALTAAVAGMSLVICCVMITVGEAHITQNTLIYLFAVLCGFTFPVSYLPAPVELVAQAIPITQGLEMLRAGMTGTGSIGGMYPELLATLGLAVAYAVIGLTWLPHAQRRAMERTY